MGGHEACMLGEQKRRPTKTYCALTQAWCAWRLSSVAGLDELCLGLGLRPSSRADGIYRGKFSKFVVLTVALCVMLIHLSLKQWHRDMHVGRAEAQASRDNFP